MAKKKVTRKLAAILAADVVGYSRLMEADEAGTLAAMKEHQRELWTPMMEQYGGRVVGTAGDSFLVEFASAVAAVECAVAIQRGMVERNADLPDDKHMPLRIGINIGEVIVDGDDIYGEGVNIAARLEALCEPGGVALSDDAHRQVEGKTKLEFADAGKHQVKNITRPVRMWRWADAIEPGGVSEPIVSELLPLPDKPSIAVLPFDNMSGDAEQEYFADGTTDEIITLLTKIPDLFVIARNSTFAYKGQSIDVRRIARELGVRYVLEGSVRKANNRIRATAQLIDAETGSHIWADRYDRDLKDIFEVQDEVAQGIAGALESRLLVAEAEFAKRKPPKSLDAWGNTVKAKMLAHNFLKADIIQAEHFARCAVELDSSYVEPIAVLAHILARRSYFGWTKDFKQTAREAVDHCERALKLDPKNAAVLSEAGAAYYYIGRVGDARELLYRSLELNPNSPLSCAMFGRLKAEFGDVDEGIGYCRRAMRLSPKDPLEYFFQLSLGAALYFGEDYSGAEAACIKALSLNPDATDAQLFLAASFVRQGRTSEAKVLIARVEAFSATAIPFLFRARTEGTIRARWTDALREAYDGRIPGEHD